MRSLVFVIAAALGALGAAAPAALVEPLRLKELVCAVLTPLKEADELAVARAARNQYSLGRGDAAPTRLVRASSAASASGCERRRERDAEA